MSPKMTDRSSWSELIKQQKREDESNNGLNGEALDRWADEGGAGSKKHISDVTLIVPVTQKNKREGRQG
jgi:hypothetical protein